MGNSVLRFRFTELRYDGKKYHDMSMLIEEYFDGDPEDRLCGVDGDATNCTTGEAQTVLNILESMGRTRLGTLSEKDLVVRWRNGKPVVRRGHHGLE